MTGVPSGSRADKATQINVGLYRLRKNSLGSTFESFVTGHDFSRADKATQINVGLQPLQKLEPEQSRDRPFFRSLFTRCKTPGRISPSNTPFSAPYLPPVGCLSPNPDFHRRPKGIVLS
jgi:hypothetical protein